MAPLPDEEQPPRPPPSTLKLIGIGFDTVAKTVGIALGTSGFFMLMKSVMDHFRMMASKNRAKARLEEMAAEEDKNDVKEEDKDDGKEEGKRLKSREVHWDHQPYYIR